MFDTCLLFTNECGRSQQCRAWLAMSKSSSCGDKGPQKATVLRCAAAWWNEIRKEVDQCCVSEMGLPGRWTRYKYNLDYVVNASVEINVGAGDFKLGGGIYTYQYAKGIMTAATPWICCHSMRQQTNEGRYYEMEQACETS